MRFISSEYREAIADYRAKWCGIDQELYELCQQYPGHSDPRGLNAKLWIIARTYATGIERKIATKKTQGSSLTQLSDHMRTHARQLDGLLQGLKEISEPLTPGKFKSIVDCHGRFVTMLKGITRTGQTPRAFASKYMHFHCPVVPIIDSYVAATLPKLVRWHPQLQVFRPAPHADGPYAWYVMRFGTLYETARDALGQSNLAGAPESTVSVKHLDYYLMWLAERLSGGRGRTYT
jgi:hypothetical protein